MTNNAYYAQALEAVQRPEEVVSGRVEVEVLERMQQDSIRERERASTTSTRVEQDATNTRDEGKSEDYTAEDKAVEKASSGDKDASGEDSGNQECCVCLAEKKSVVLLPCRHMCVCVACGLDNEQLLTKCPMCRTAIEHRIKVFT